MSDYISREAAKDICKKYNGKGYVWAKIHSDICQLTAADVVGIRRPDHGYMWICPECGLELHSDYSECVQCGYKRADVPEQKWIPVSERLPEEDYCTGYGKQFSVDVVMTVYNASEEGLMIDFGHTVDGEWYSEVYDEWIELPDKVLAWMPLPEPYKGESC